MTLKDCFEKGLLRKTETSQNMIEKELFLSKENLAEAGELHKLGHEKAAAIFIYTSMFHSARAILFKDGYSERSHTCISLYVVDKFVKTGKLEAKYINSLDELKQKRHQTFYGTPATYETEEIGEFFETAKEFIGEVKKLVKS